VLDTAASTPWAATHVPPVVLKDTKETDNIVEVRELGNFCTAIFVYIVYPVLYMSVTICSTSSQSCNNSYVLDAQAYSFLKMFCLTAL